MAISSSFTAKAAGYILSPFSQSISNNMAQHRNMRINDYIFDLTDSEEYSSSDDESQFAGQYYCHSDSPDWQKNHQDLKYKYGNKEEQKIVHRRFVAPAAIGRPSEWECQSRDVDADHERILQAACTDARFDTILGRPAIADDQPCCCQQCQPLSPRSTALAPHMQEEQLEQSGIYTNTDRSRMSSRFSSSSPGQEEQLEQSGVYTNTDDSGISSRSSSSSSRTSSFICYRSAYSSCSRYIYGSYEPSGRCLSPIEKAIDPLECEIVDASFWVWKWPPDEEEVIIGK
ncbi:hypothetical protein BGX38DRAFT_1332982 [Terfezia claveryi]|nr:hypothetical protein BGX38DRAFT_1332982 [Terfezia claveryi]